MSSLRSNSVRGRQRSAGKEVVTRGGEKRGRGKDRVVQRDQLRTAQDALEKAQAEFHKLLRIALGAAEKKGRMQLCG